MAKWRETFTCSAWQSVSLAPWCWCRTTWWWRLCPRCLAASWRGTVSGWCRQSLRCSLKRCHSNFMLNKHESYVSCPPLYHPCYDWWLCIHWCSIYSCSRLVSCCPSTRCCTTWSWSWSRSRPTPMWWAGLRCWSRDLLLTFLDLPTLTWTFHNSSSGHSSGDKPVVGHHLSYQDLVWRHNQNISWCCQKYLLFLYRVAFPRSDGCCRCDPPHYWKEKVNSILCQ